MKIFATIIISILFLANTWGRDTIKIDSISKIQLCLILDVSGSMNGLLNQAQNEIWKTISFLERFTKDGLETAVEISVVSYGNRDYAESGHVKIITDFTRNIDKVAEKLWMLKEGGSLEFCGKAIKTSVDSLSWDVNNIFKCLIIAGNETFNQGEENFEIATKMAVDKEILLNTIYCGDRETGTKEYWKLAADLGNGSYANIDQSINMEEFKTPYDNKIIQLYFDLKSSYFDQKSEDEKLNQFDSKGEVSPAFRDMIIYKFYRTQKNKEMDLIDKFNDSNWELDSFEKSEIPEIWQDLKTNELKFKLLEFSRKRNAYKKAFQLYARKVEEFLEISVKPKLTDKTLNLAMNEIMKKQLTEFGYIEK